eukprot:7441950-Alexandrium_andersonii.AAC.1
MCIRDSSLIHPLTHSVGRPGIPSLSLTHSLTLSLTQPLTHSLTHSLTTQCSNSKGLQWRIEVASSRERAGRRVPEGIQATALEARPSHGGATPPWLVIACE